MVNTELLYASAFFGLVIGFIFGIWWDRRKSKKQLKKAEEDIKKQNLVVGEVGMVGKRGLESFPASSPTMKSEEIAEVEQIPPIEPITPPQNLKPCMICGKLTETNTCSMEHYNLAMQQHHSQSDHLSEGDHEPKKEEVNKLGKKESSDTLTSSPDTSEEKTKNQAETIKELMRKVEDLEKSSPKKGKKK